MSVSISGFNGTSTNPNATLTGVQIDWGDGDTATVAPSAITAQTPQAHTYTATPANGITATPIFTVAGQTETVPGTACAIPVSFTATPPPVASPPANLPNTGAGDTIAIFLGAIVAGTIAARVFLARKLARS
jgi:LPXTG-motif cell wall-anchored protein